MLILLGAILLISGILLNHWRFFSSIGIGHLPGDMRIRRGDFSFYFPLTTCILLSIFLSLIIYFFRK
jgi:hypothetical protein